MRGRVLRVTVTFKAIGDITRAYKGQLFSQVGKLNRYLLEDEDVSEKMIVLCQENDSAVLCL